MDARGRAPKYPIANLRANSRYYYPILEEIHDKYNEVRKGGARRRLKRPQEERERPSELTEPPIIRPIKRS